MSEGAGLLALRLARQRAQSANAPTGKVGAADIVDLMKGLTKLPTLPVIALRAMQLIKDESSSAKELAELLSKDQAASARLLRVANSAFYALRRPVSTVREAIVVLGFANVQSLVLTSTVINQFAGDAESGFDRAQCWQHSVGCGIASEMLARCSRHPEPAEVFTAGILHDIGRMILDQYFHGQFLAILRLVAQEGIPSVVAEGRLLGTDHARIGGALARQWKVPDQLIEAISYHHDPGSASEGVGIAQFVHLGDIYCMQHGLYSGFAEGFDPPSDVVMNKLGLAPDAIEQLLAPFENIQTRAAAFLSSACS